MAKAELKQGDSEDFAGKKEVIADAVQHVRDMAESRAASEQMKVQAQRPALHLVPMEENREAAYDAAAWLEKRQQEEVDRLAKVAAEEAAEYQYYLKCRNPRHVVGDKTAPPHGVYFTKNPLDGVVGDHEWYAKYKRPDEIWRQPICCQVCLLMAIEEPVLCYEWTDARRGLWRPDRRWVFKTPKDVKVWEVEGDTRAGDLPTGASNLWREDVAKRRAAAGLAVKGA